MPVAIPIIISAIASAAAATSAFTVGLWGLSILTTSLIVGGVSLVLGAAQSLLAPKAKVPKSGGPLTAVGSPTTPVNQPNVPRRCFYGEARVAGAYMFWDTTNNNANDHVVIAIASHELAEMGTIYMDAEPIYPEYIDGSGNVTSGKYKGAVIIKKHLGADDQSADADLVSAISYLTDDFTLSGTAYIYFNFTAGIGVFPNGIPNIQVEIKGRLMFDPRDNGTRYCMNPALCIRDYMVDLRYGRQTAANRFNDDYTISESNICDEFVTTLPVAFNVTAVDATLDDFASADTLVAFQTGDRVQITSSGSIPGGLSGSTNYYVIVKHLQPTTITTVPIDPCKIQLASSYTNAMSRTAINITSVGSGTITITKNGEPRYTCNGFVEISRSWRDIVTDMLTSMGGTLQQENGLWTMLSAVYRSPTITYDDDDVRGAVQIATKVSRSSRFNCVQGSYVSPLNFSETQTYPSVQSSEYISEDNGNTIFATLDLPFTTRASTCQRLATIYLNRHRQQLSVQIDLKISGLLSRSGDVIQFTNSTCGWIEQLLEIASMSLVQHQDPTGAPLLGVQIVALGVSPAVYDYDPTALEIAVLPSQQSNLPDPTVAAPPGAITLASGDDQLYIKADGTVVSRLLISWIAAQDAFVQDYEVQYKLTADSVWLPVTSGGGQLSVFVWDVADGAVYDVRVRSINYLAVKSIWVYSYDYTIVGKTAKPATPDSFSVVRLADGTRQFSFGLSNAPADVRVGGGFEIRYGVGVVTDWSIMTPITTQILRTSPFETNILAAGFYSFACKTIDSSGNESTTATFIEATLGDPRLAGSLVQTIENPNWPGTLINAEIDAGQLEPISTGTWASLPSTWSALASQWASMVSSASTFSYISNILNLGFAATFTPLLTPVGADTLVTSYLSNLSIAADAGNVLLNPDDFTTTWTATATAVTANQANAPEGTLAMDKVIPSASNVAHFLNQTKTSQNLNQAWTFAVYYQPKGYNRIQLQIIDNTTTTNSVNALFDCTAGTAGTVVDSSVSGTATGVTTSITPVGDGTYLCIVSGTKVSTSGNTTINVQAKIVSNAATSSSATNAFIGDTISGGYLWRGQLKAGSVASPWTATPTTQLVGISNIRFKVDVTDGASPYAYLTSLSIILDAQANTDSFLSLNTSTYSAVWFQRIGAGHFYLGSNSGKINTITQATINALQNTGPGFTWELISKTATLSGSGKVAAEFKIYNSSGTLTDATIDVDISGV